MIERGWKWWVGSDGERFHTECATREEAVQIAKSDDGGYIIEARHADIKLSAYFDASDFLENAEDNASDDFGDPEGGDPIFDVTPEQIEHLATVVRDAIDFWQKLNRLTFRGHWFAASRNCEYIPAKGPSE